MNRVAVIGAALTVAGLAGYGYGVAAAYPGRALSVTAVMVGLTLLAMQGAFGSTEGAW